MVLFDRIVRALEDLLSSASSSVLSSVSGIALATLGSTLMLGSKHLAARWLFSSIPPAPVAIASFSLDALFQTESFERALIGATPPTTMTTTTTTMTTSNGRQFWTRLLLCGAIHGTGAIVLGSGVAKFLSHEANPGIRDASPSTHVLVPGMIAYQWLDALHKDTERGGDQETKKTHQTPSVGDSANEDGCEDETPTIASARGPNHDDSVGAERVPTRTNRDENNTKKSNEPGAPNHPTRVKQAVDGHAVSELDSQTTRTGNDETVSSSICSAPTVSSGTDGVASASVGRSGNPAVVGGSDENGPGVTRASPTPAAGPNDNDDDEDGFDRTATPGSEDAANPQ